MAVPPVLLDQLDLQVGAVVGLEVEGGRLIVQSRRKPRYTLEELLLQCSPDDPILDEDREWLDAPSVGQEG
jgi:antitoxin ChpS